MRKKKCQGRVFCVCWWPYLLFLWFGEIVLSDDFSASGNQLIIFRILKNQTKAVSVMKRTMNQYVSIAGFRLQLFSFHNEKILLPSGPNTQVQRSMFPFIFRALYRSMRKAVKGECSVLLTAIPVVPWLDERVLSGDFWARSSMHLVFFQKMQ